MLASVPQFDLLIGDENQNHLSQITSSYPDSAKIRNQPHVRKNSQIYVHPTKFPCVQHHAIPSHSLNKTHQKRLPVPIDHSPAPVSTSNTFLLSNHDPAHLTRPIIELIDKNRYTRPCLLPPRTRTPPLYSPWRARKASLVQRCSENLSQPP